MLPLLFLLSACDKDKHNKKPLPEPAIIYDESCDDNMEEAYLGRTIAAIDHNGDG